METSSIVDGLAMRTASVMVYVYDLRIKKATSSPKRRMIIYIYEGCRRGGEIGGMM